MESKLLAPLPLPWMKVGEVVAYGKEDMIWILRKLDPETYRLSNMAYRLYGVEFSGITFDEYANEES